MPLVQRREVFVEPNVKILTCCEDLNMETESIVKLHVSRSWDMTPRDDITFLETIPYLNDRDDSGAGNDETSAVETTQSGPAHTKRFPTVEGSST